MNLPRTIVTGEGWGRAIDQLAGGDLKLLALPLVLGLIIGFGALMLRLQGMVFGASADGSVALEASHLPMFAHLAIVFMAGIYLPPPLVAGFRNVAKLLG